MNRELYVRVLQQIVENPKTWGQHNYARHTDCGTAYCFAGWSQMLQGKGINEMKVPLTSTLWLDVFGRVTVNVPVVFMDAMNDLGITPREALWLFNAGRTIDDFFQFLEKHEDHSSTDNHRESDRVGRAASGENTGAACVSDHQSDLCGAGQKR